MTKQFKTSIQRPKIKKSDKLFFNQYEYSVAVSFGGAKNPWRLTAEKLRKLKARCKNVNSFVKKVVEIYELASMTMPDGYAEFFEVYFKTSKDLKVVTNYTYFYCYTNATDLITELSRLPHLRAFEISKTVIDRPIGTLIRPTSEYSFRTYLRQSWLDDQTKKRLASFFKTHDDQLQLSKTLSQFLSMAGKMCNNYYFFDHHDKDFLLMFEIAFPQMIRKTVTILKENTNGRDSIS